MTTDPLGMLLRAVRFAAEKHRAQRRKDSDGSPYINHPVSVAELFAIFLLRTVITVPVIALVAQAVF